MKSRVYSITLCLDREFCVGPVCDTELPSRPLGRHRVLRSLSIGHGGLPRPIDLLPAQGRAVQ